MARLTPREAQDIYRVENWSEGYLDISSRGTLTARPLGPNGPRVDLLEIVESLAKEGTPAPVVLRFPQILQHRVDRLNTAFQEALKANGCKAAYRGVFPVKVNQHREVVKTLARAGRKWRYGLEVGSKAELVAALTMDPNRKSLLIVNGFKDRTFLEAACHAAHFKDRVIIVLDEIGELDHLLPIMKNLERKPLLGIRLKLRSKAPGKWALSGGERAKFGLTIPEVLHAVERLKAAGHLDQLAMLHFHIGSQISDIRRISRGVREAARIHAEMVKMGIDLRYLDTGGGLAVDYDGSGSSGANSANYSLEEYANTVVAQIKDVCDEQGVDMPDLISESGRAVVAHHAVLVVNVLRRVPSYEPQPDPDGAREDDPISLANLYQTYQDLSSKNAFESFHDALELRDDMQNLFDLGHLSLEALSRSEVLFRSILERIRQLLEAEDETESEEYEQASALFSRKLVANFSLFQSLPDVWGVKQQFPMLPLHRLSEKPTGVATVADITCDSDGEIRRFIDVAGSSPHLAVHDLLPDKPYYLAMCLVGAYQDALGDYHNLFGETNEAWIEVDADGQWSVTRILPGSRVADMLQWVRYDPTDLRRRLRMRIKRLRESGRLTADEARDVTNDLMQMLNGSSYLEGPN